MPEFRVLAHKRVLNFLKILKDEILKDEIKEAISDLEKYPTVLGEPDIERIEGLESGYRIRVGGYRMVFVVDKIERTIFVTHVGKREFSL